MVLGIATLCLLLVGGIWIGSDARPAEKRRLLQNLVYRGYRFLAWLLAVWQGVDAGLSAYYSFRSQTEILPINERSFPPVPAGKEEMALTSACGDRVAHRRGAQPLPLTLVTVMPGRGGRRRAAHA